MKEKEDSKKENESDMEEDNLDRETRRCFKESSKILLKQKNQKLSLDETIGVRKKKTNG